MEFRQVLQEYFFNQSPARSEDYLEANNLLDSHEDKNVGYLFPERFCGDR